MAVATFLERDRTPVVRWGSLSHISQSYTLRCDAKQSEKCFSDFTQVMSGVGVVQLGSYFPRPFSKGIQPAYLETLDAEGVPVISTIAIQHLSIIIEACRYITQEDFDQLSEERKLKSGDVLVTMDGGTSIGKPVLFELDEDFTVDSHIAILRPEGLAPLALVYLLASPLGQLQFQQAESGASGQTAVTEEDIRRFVFPRTELETLNELVINLHSERMSIQSIRQELDGREAAAWHSFNQALLRVATGVDK